MIHFPSEGGFFKQMDFRLSPSGEVHFMPVFTNFQADAARFRSRDSIDRFFRDYDFLALLPDWHIETNRDQQFRE